MKTKINMRRHRLTVSSLLLASVVVLLAALVASVLSGPTKGSPEHPSVPHSVLYPGWPLWISCLRTPDGLRCRGNGGGVGFLLISVVGSDTSQSETTISAEGSDVRTHLLCEQSTRGEIPCEAWDGKRRNVTREPAITWTPFRRAPC